jgi:uncharacterized protein
VVEYKKPLPITDIDSQKYWDACHRHELQLQKCQDCNKFYFPPAPVCPKCFSTNVNWEKISGKGTVFTFTVVHRPPSPDMEAYVPYVISVIELDEGPKMVSNIVGCKYSDVKIGMKVEVFFEDVAETISLPMFKPVT